MCEAGTLRGVYSPGNGVSPLEQTLHIELSYRARALAEKRRMKDAPLEEASVGESVDVN
jgi:hypothetical protein